MTRIETSKPFISSVKIIVDRQVGGELHCKGRPVREFGHWSLELIGDFGVEICDLRLAWAK